MNKTSIDGATEFSRWKIENELLDIPFKGPRFTWCNNSRIGKKRVYERIDKALGSKDWFFTFPNTGVFHHPIQISDHALIEIDLCLTDARECRVIILNSWKYFFVGSPVICVVRKIAKVRDDIKRWVLDKRKEWRRKWEDFDEKLIDTMVIAITDGNELPNIIANEELKEFAKAVALFWRQRAKLKWCMDGDTCNKFFFNLVKGWAGTIFIFGVKEENGQWMFGGRSFNWVPRALKSPGPDGILAALFQKYWYVVKEDITEAVMSALNSGFILNELNRTFITLVPKCQNPENVTDYQPISLCNVMMKIITKCIANKLARVMEYIVGDFQNVFVPGRLIIDNILLAHEAIHSINSHRSGVHGRFAFKADMSKAYDSVSRAFLLATLRGFGFPEKLVLLIMSCVTTVSYEVLVNGTPHPNFKSRCGLRQGDPISPFLFIICMEVLSYNVANAQVSGSLAGIQLCRETPPLTHLFFADDSIFFLQDKNNACS
ncbi:uncharacterized protein LOC141640759 [Silene latifolia]|uniref:uncharacterized protein LOC141640759 n=1 Tax=Silene latifolia TaxID=37657 RepID=UPI003D77CA10